MERCLDQALMLMIRYSIFTQHGVFLEQKLKIAEIDPDLLHVDDQCRTGSYD